MGSNPTLSVLVLDRRAHSSKPQHLAISVNAFPKNFSELSFDNRFARLLPCDPVTQNHVRQVQGACYSKVAPSPVRAPSLFAWSHHLAQELGIAEPLAEQRNIVAEVLAGNRLLPGMEPYAACYGGHQFGHWAGQLGDGRAITLGEHLDPRGDRWDFQLKGAGPTPYSRRGDGRAVLRSSLREFLCSEAMHHLGVPTTRALSLVTCREEIPRDMFYDGRIEWEPCAIVTRVAPSFIRFGHFQIFAARGDLGLLQQLADYVLSTFYPSWDQADPHRYKHWYFDVCERTALMVAHWMRVGFVHGVMNTDNMSILGLTIDYGPYGWLDVYDPQWTPNTTDAGQRRYRFGQQPAIALWNLAQFAEALRSLIPDAGILEAGLDRFKACFQMSYGRFMSQKLGLQKLEGKGDQTLLLLLEEALTSCEIDMTLFYHHLAEVARDDTFAEALGHLRPAFYPDQLPASAEEALSKFIKAYQARLLQDELTLADRLVLMRAHNPQYVLRNYLAQLAIDAAHTGDAGPTQRLLKVLERPYETQEGHEDLIQRRPEWARHKAGCSALSCSS